MEKYELSYDKDEEIIKCIKDIILSKHPIVEDRSHVLYPSFNEPRTPEMNIDFNFYRTDDNDITQIMFQDGTCDYKMSMPDKIQINGLMSEKGVCDFISYLLTDHDIFRSIYKDDTRIELFMTVNGCDENMHGISCGDINLKFNFRCHPDCTLLLNKYLKTIVTNFYEKLKSTSMFQEEFSKYCNLVKVEFINSLTSEELRCFIDLLNNQDLCSLIHSIPNNRFIELYNEQQGIKKLVKD